MRQFTAFLTLLLMLALPSPAKRRAPATTSPTITISCSVCSATAPMTITATGFTAGAFAVLTVSGPYVGLTGASVNSAGEFSETYLNGLQWPPGSYLVSLVDEFGLSAATSFTIV